MPSNLESVKDLIDGVCILDTGSTDNTIQVIQDWCTANSKWCQTFEEAFVNFGKSRTRSFELAKAAVTEKFGSESLKETYAFFLDADAEVIEFQDPSKKLEDQQKLQLKTIEKFKEYMTKEMPKCLYNQHVLTHTSYIRLGLARMDLSWKCKNACHEQWDVDDTESPGQHNAQIMVPFKVFEKATGGMKPSKLQRELSLLEQDILDGNKTPRNLFYQGRALDSVKRQDEALTTLQECVETSTWNEERYEARLIMARIWALRDAEDQKVIEDLVNEKFPGSDDKLKHFKIVSKEVKQKWPSAHEKSMRLYWQAHNDMPWRAEALQQVAFQYRIRKEYRNAVNTIRIALENVELPRDETSSDTEKLHLNWVAMVSSLFSLSGSWIVQASQRRTALFQNKDILFDKLLEELALSALVMPDPEWRLRGHRAAEFLQDNARTPSSKAMADNLIQMQRKPKN